MDHYFCTDEDVCNAAPQDYYTLAHRDQCLARGTDGELSTAWTLNSPTAALGSVGPGCVVHLYGPKTAFPPPGEVFGVASPPVGGSQITLKRRGQAPFQGQPPTTQGLTGVVFRALTFAPQILAASLDLGRRFGISDQLAGQRFADLFDPTQLRDAAVFAVLADAYRDASRGTGMEIRIGNPDYLQVKALHFTEAYRDLLSRLTLTWQGASATAPGRQSPIRTVRLER